MAENTISRIKIFIDSKDISIRALEMSVGMSNGSFASQLKNNKTIGVDKIENILNEYPDLNPTWLLTGRGEMLLPPTNDSDNMALSCNSDSDLMELLREKDRQIDHLLTILGNLTNK